MKAAGRYLRTLREARGLSQEDVGRLVGAVGKTVYEWERGMEPRAINLAAYIDAVGGSAGDVIGLLNDPEATADDGAAVAKAWLAREVQRAEGRDDEDDANRVVRAAVEILQSPELIQEIIRRVDERYDAPKESGPQTPWTARLRGSRQL